MQQSDSAPASNSTTSGENGSSHRMTLVAGGLTLVVAVAGATAVLAQPSKSNKSVNVTTLNAATVPEPLLNNLTDAAQAASNGVSSVVSNSTTTVDGQGAPTSISTSIENGQASVTVNGQAIDLPGNGSVTQTVPDGAGGQTNVSISVDNNGTSSTGSSSSRININSHHSAVTNNRSTNISIGSQ